LAAAAIEYVEGGAVAAVVTFRVQIRGALTSSRLTATLTATAV
jgi:hypothetical protein